ncbi:DUF4157 domain-containing protein [Myxococcus sp. K15C18031901]|uniref:eCIS core domain-containing protein n=1 Tax=Myxococcus dinghuensis TaxID=2906761 RepID=UPI0020A821A0|nr:DUF4157 domain-containing protein [Myxococcus dinghuensis]MCP3099990.1 DUF4157 domain-containing protein [Myxococcus dinghuensis]
MGDVAHEPQVVSNSPVQEAEGDGSGPGLKTARSGALLQLQRAFDQSPRVTARANQAQALQRRAAPRNETGLPDDLKTGVESLSGLTMDDVRVHYNSSMPAQLQALAYTQGSDIHVAPGQEQHLAHEAWHVVQQKQGRVRPTRQLQSEPLNDDAGLEHEADVMGSRAVGLDVGRLPLQRRRDASAVSGGAPVQRVAVQLGTDDVGNIDEINVGGRAGSLWPQERHHTTPWQSYLDTLDGDLSTLSIPEAVLTMNDLDDHLRTLPGWGLRNYLEANKRAAFQGAVVELQNRRAATNLLADDSPLLALSLQRYIQQWLVVRSKLPLAQSDAGGGAGNVAEDTAVARDANTGGIVDDDDLRDALFRMFDFQTVRNVFTDPDDGDVDDEYENFGFDPAAIPLTLEQLRARAFEQHARSIQKAYPTAFGQLYAGANALTTMVAEMEAHWGVMDDMGSEASESEAEASDSEMSD